MPLPKRKIHVLHVITGLNRGGAEQQLFQLLKDKTVSHTVFSLTDKGEMRQEVRNWTTTVSIGSATRRPFALWWTRLRSHLRKERPDIVMGWMYHGSIAAQSLRIAGFRGPIIWNIRHSLHDIRKEQPALRSVIRAGSLASNWATHIVYNSNRAKEQHENVGFGHKHSSVIHNGIDLQRFTPSSTKRKSVRSKLAVKPGEFIIGIVGRSHPMKNHDGWLEVFSHLIATHRHLRCLIIGAGVPRQLTPVVRRFGLENRVWLKEVNASLEDYYPGLDLLVLPSLWGEAFPNVISEAMACGVPVVATPLGDVPELVANGGIVAENADSKGILEAVNRALNLIDARVEGNTDHFKPREAASRFDASLLREQYRTLYQEVLNKNSS